MEQQHRAERQAGARLALVVEDEALLALEMEDVLRSEGFEARLACTELAALAEHPDTLSVAVVNLRLNGRLLGHEVIRRLRRRQPHLPVVVVTGYDSDAPQADLRGLGWPTARLQKPMQGDALTAALRSVIAQARTGLRPAGGRRRMDREARPSP
ncbi:response regulator [Paracraurococcus lichenis]|uniref:Response regulator n=1 Tax=Paracraurococcus lichenis TaxID=3064888 RepID=A0ABT9E2C5_9PROT|nr:response regulator [Paracraurococcus sp. LOR1-02]MDO9710296.1 response regulator [Paracraurococcus sp. LOR1-02]